MSLFLLYMKNFESTLYAFGSFSIRSMDWVAYPRVGRTTARYRLCLLLKFFMSGLIFSNIRVTCWLEHTGLRFVSSMLSCLSPKHQGPFLGWWLVGPCYCVTIVSLSISTLTTQIYCSFKLSNFAALKKLSLNFNLT